MDRIFRGKRVEDVRLVEVERGERVVLLPLKPSLHRRALTGAMKGAVPRNWLWVFCMKSLGMWRY